MSSLSAIIIIKYLLSFSDLFLLFNSVFDEQN